MAEPAPTVAVVIPCYNHGAFLGEALASVRAQTYPHVTCTVVDDGSTDADTQRVIAKLRDRDDVTLIEQPNAGLAAARNAGIRATDAAFFVPLDADDRLQPQFIEKLLPPLLRDERLGYAYCHIRTFGAGEALHPCHVYEPRRLLLYNLSNPSAVVRRAAFDAVGGYQPDMREGYEDWDYWIALLRAGYRGRLVPEALFDYRLHAPGVSMLSRARPHHDMLVRRIIAHHAPLYRDVLDLGGIDEEEIFDEVNAALQLDRIAAARSWRWLNRLTGGSEFERGRPTQQLGRVQAGWPFKLIAAIKRFPLVEAYARWRYPDQPRAERQSTWQSRS